jgi:hypothetical protein
MIRRMPIRGRAAGRRPCGLKSEVQNGFQVAFGVNFR